MGCCVARKRLYVGMTVFLCFFVSLGFFLHSLFAQRGILSIDDVIATGKNQLFQKSVQGALDAHQTFKAAYLDPAYAGASSDQKIKIRAYLAFTRLFDVTLRTDGGGIDTLTELMAAYGITRTGTTIETLTFQFPNNKNDLAVLPATAPSGEAIRAFLAGPFLTAVNASIADMDEVITLCGSGEGKEIIAKGLISATQPLNVEVDVGDYYLFRAALKALKAYAIIISAYNMDVNIKEIAGLINADVLNFKSLLDRYPQLLKLLTSGGTPAYDGVAKLMEAKTALIGAIDDYTTASDKIRNDADTTFGAEELTTIETADLLQEKYFREEGVKIKASLNGSAGPVYEKIRDKETWEFTETATGNKIQVVWKDRKTSGSWWSLNYYQSTLFIGYGWNIAYTAINGSDLTLRLSTNGTYNNQWFGVAEFRGTLSGNGMQLSGTFRTGLSFQTWDQMTSRGAFTASLVAYDDSKRDHINLNAVLGNGAAAPDLRDLLPEFTAYGWGIPKVGTMGHGLGDDATLNGLLPDFTQPLWAEKIDILQQTGTAAVPTVANNAITIDGLVGDWAGISPVYSNTYGDHDSDPGRNIDKLFLAKDSANLYLRMDMAGARSSEAGSYDYAVRFTNRPGNMEDMAGDMRLWAAYKGYMDQWTFTTAGSPAKQLSIALWGIDSWGNYSQGSGVFTGPAGDAVFPQIATLQNGYISGNYIYLNFGSFYVSGTLNADQTQVTSGSFVIYSPYTSGNFMGVRLGHAPYWQTYFAKMTSSNQWGAWQYQGDNMSMGVGTHVEWKVPLSQIGSVAGLFIQPETKLWSGWWRQGVEDSTAIQVDTGATAQTVAGTLDIPGYDGTGVIMIGVYEYHGFNPASEYRLAGTLIYPGQYTAGMTYTIPNIPVGRRVFVAVNWDRNNYGFAGPGDYTNFYEPFTTTAGTKVLNIAATDDHPAYPAPSFNSVHAFRIYQTNSSTNNYNLFAFVTGPSPEDVTVTATGPSGQVYTLKPTRFNFGVETVASRGISYQYGSTTPLPEGTYTFEAIDTLGRKATATKTYAYNGTLPIVDYTKLLPGSYTGASLVPAYAGTATPALTWTIPAGVPATSRWQVSVKDYNTGNVLFKSELLSPETNSYTVPSGFLQTGTNYNWYVILWDGQLANGILASTILSTNAYTDPVSLAWAYLVTIPPTGTITTYSHYVPFSLAVLPPDINTVRLKNAGGQVVAQATTSSGLSHYTRLYKPGYYQFGFSSANPLPAGNYTVEVDLKRNSGLTLTSQAIPYAFQAVQPLDVTSLVPASDYYFNTTVPTFSWAATADANAWYHVRIYNPINDTAGPAVEMYRSPWLKNATSWQVPAGVLKPGMSYYYALSTSSDYDPNGSSVTGQWHSQVFANVEGNSSTMTMYRFTINAYHTKGDLNNDNAVKLEDAIIALQVISGVTPSQVRLDYVSSGVDVDGDNKIGLPEVLYILQSVAGTRN